MGELLLSVQLRCAIEDFAARLRGSPLLETTRRGRLSPRAFGLYLESLRYLFDRSHATLARAARHCDELGRCALAEYFQHKATEERGHDRWAADDMAHLPTEAVEGLAPARAIQGLLDMQLRMVEQEPALLAVYVLWAEYFSILVGDEWLEALGASGFPRERVTAIAKHLDADRHHAAAGFRVIDGLWDEQQLDPQLATAAVQEAGRLFEAFCAEVLAENRVAA